MPTSPVVIGLLLFSATACLLALAKGGRAERIAGAIVLANLLAGMAGALWFHSQLFLLAADGLTALALLPLTMRYLNAWLGAVMILYGLQFALHAAYAVLERPNDLLHAVLNNIDFMAVNACLMGATLVTWTRRRRGLAT